MSSLYKMGDVIINLNNVNYIEACMTFLYIQFKDKTSYKYPCSNPQALLKDIYARF